MLNDLELIKKLRDFSKQNGYKTGICNNLFEMFSVGLLDYMERSRLETILSKELPKGNDCYNWDKGKSLPRNRFLNKLVKKYEGRITE